MNNIWLVMVAVGLLTFATRLSFILLQERWHPSKEVTRALRFVPIAALTGIFVPEILLYSGFVEMGIVNPRLLAGAGAIIVAWRTKSALWTIGAGMVVFWLLSFLL